MIQELKALCQQHNIDMTYHRFPTSERSEILDILYSVLQSKPINMEILDQVVIYLDNNELSLGLFDITANENISLIKYFISKGANPYHTDMFNRNMMHCASQNSPEVIRYTYDLIGADCFRREETGETAIFNAVSSGKIENIKLLQDLGFDITTKDQQGVSVMYDALISVASQEPDKMSIDVIAYLYQQGVRISKGFGGLQMAIDRGEYGHHLTNFLQIHKELLKFEDE